MYICNNIVSGIPSHFIRILFYRNIMNFYIGNGSSILLGVKFLGRGNFEMGKNSVINARCVIDNRNKIQIGDSCSISAGVTLLCDSHDIDSEYFHGKSLPKKIGDLVFIGWNAIVLPGADMGKGAVLSAGSVLVNNAVDGGVYAGNPAILVRKRTSELNYKIDHRPLFQ
jgi:maltose O-acetyltransferase